MKPLIKKKTRNTFPPASSKWMIFSAVLFLLLAAPLLPHADEEFEIAIIPFRVSAKDNLSFMKNATHEMLSSRLSREFRIKAVNPDETPDFDKIDARTLDEKEIRGLGKKLNAGYILMGSLTVIGESFSIDARLIPADPAKPVLSFFKQDASTEKIIPAITAIADEISKALSTHPADAAFSQAPLPETNSMTPLAARFQMSSPFEIEIKGLALGDVDGDKKVETIIAGNKELRILCFEKENIRSDFILPLPGNHSPIAIDAADIKKDDRAEIFITCQRAGTDSFDSFVLEWDGNTFREICRKADWYFRVITPPRGAPLLLGQERGIADLFFPGIYRMEWTGDNFTPGKKLNLPGETILFGVATGNFIERDTESIAALNLKDNLSIFNPHGTCVWESESRFGGSESFVEWKQASTEDSRSRIYLPQRLLVADLDNDLTKDELILVENEESSGRFFSRFRNYKSGGFNGFSWNGQTMTRIIQTDIFEGYIADYAMGDMHNDGKTEIVAALVKKPASIYRRANSVIISCPLSILTGKSEKNP